MDINKIKSFSNRLLVEEALRRGIEVRHINEYQDEAAFLEMSCGKHFEYTIGTNLSKNTCTSLLATENKALAKSLLSRSGVSVAEGRLFHKNNIDRIEAYVEKIKYPIVVKKYNGAHGDLVFTGINTREERDEAVKKILAGNDYVLVEKQCRGVECRIVATRKKVLAAMMRDPANVVGDGAHNLRELIDIKNSDPRRGEGHDKSLTKIAINDIVENYLKEQKKSLDTVPAKGEKIYLRRNANLSTGGDSLDITDELHRDFKKIAVQAVRAIPGLVYAGVDLMAESGFFSKPKPGSYIVIEMNASPGIRAHHFPAQGKSRNVAGEIVDLLFPETKSRKK